MKPRWLALIILFLGTYAAIPRDRGNRWRRTALYRPTVVHRTVGRLHLYGRVAIAVFG